MLVKNPTLGRFRCWPVGAPRVLANAAVLSARFIESWARCKYTGAIVTPASLACASTRSRSACVRTPDA